MSLNRIALALVPILLALAGQLACGSEPTSAPPVAAPQTAAGLQSTPVLSAAGQAQEISVPGPTLATAENTREGRLETREPGPSMVTTTPDRPETTSPSEPPALTESAPTPDPTQAVAPSPTVVRVSRSTRTRETAPEATSEDLTALVNGNSEFAFDLYRTLDDTDGNLFFSPYTISLALAMAYAGAGSDTERQMANTLQFTLPEDRLHSAFNALDLVAQLL